MQAQSEESPRQSSVLSPQALPPGTRVGRWRVEFRVGGGGNGTVYAVRKRSKGRRYALKLAHEPEDRRFERESEALSRVHHPGVVRLVEEGVWHAGPVRYPFLVMEYVEGESLYDWALARNPTARQVAGLLWQAAEALAEAHRRGVLHRDFKGDNARVRRDGRLVVLDWGAGWHPGAQPLTSAARLPPGTAPYHSPQALLFSVRAQRGRAGGHYHYMVADELYAVGAACFRVLVEQYPPLRLSEAAGEVPEECSSWAVSTLNPRVPQALAALVQRLLAFRPEARPPSAQALAEEARRMLAGAGPEWDEPLFEWYAGPTLQTRTTSVGAAPGPVAPGQEVPLRLARTRHLDWARQHREKRRVRRRELARVLTLPGSRATVPAGARWLPGTWRALAVGALVTATGVAWALARGDALFPAPPPEPPAGRQQLAPPPGPAETAPPAAALPFPSFSPPWPEEAMSTTEPRLLCPTRLHRSLLAATAAASLTACPATQVRPDPARCPSDALEAMRQLRLVTGRGHGIDVDVRAPRGNPGLHGNVVVSDGPITSQLSEPFGKLPEGTRLYGRLWTEGQRVHGRYTRVRTPDGSEYPVCFILTDAEGSPKEDGSRPGYTLLNSGRFVTVVDRFP